MRGVREPFQRGRLVRVDLARHAQRLAVVQQHRQRCVGVFGADGPMLWIAARMGIVKIVAGLGGQVGVVEHFPALWEIVPVPRRVVALYGADYGIGYHERLESREPEAEMGCGHAICEHVAEQAAVAVCLGGSPSRWGELGPQRRELPQVTRTRQIRSPYRVVAPPVRSAHGRLALAPLGLLVASKHLLADLDVLVVGSDGIALGDGVPRTRHERLALIVRDAPALRPLEVLGPVRERLHEGHVRVKHDDEVVICGRVNAILQPVHQAVGAILLWVAIVPSGRREMSLEGPQAERRHQERLLALRVALAPAHDAHELSALFDFRRRVQQHDGLPVLVGPAVRAEYQAHSIVGIIVLPVDIHAAFPPGPLALVVAADTKADVSLDAQHLGNGFAHVRTRTVFTNSPS
mmetsp:Transcript_2676/g.10699  ORF Transcript_2676/g.10699 Transcript_2676/m.10699 type:complete len:406 (+) Transcript_2676:2220-3437(+)